MILYFSSIIIETFYIFVLFINHNYIFALVCYLIHNESTKEREFVDLWAIKDNYRKIVVSLDPLISDKTYKGIEHLHLRAFLRNVEI